MSYTPEETEQVVREYIENPTRENVEEIAARVSKTPRSVIAKLAAAGVYQTPQRTTKTGEPIIKKERLVEEINEFLDIKVESLVKTGKQDLITLHAAIKQIAIS